MQTQGNAADFQPWVDSHKKKESYLVSTSKASLDELQLNDIKLLWSI